MPPAPSALADLVRLRAENGRGVYGSGDQLFRDAIFGRDAVQTAEDLLLIRPDIARESILTLGSLQGGPLRNGSEIRAAHRPRGSFRLDQAEGVRRDQPARLRGTGRPVPTRSKPARPAPPGEAGLEAPRASSR